MKYNIHIVLSILIISILSSCSKEREEMNISGETKVSFVLNTLSKGLFAGAEDKDNIDRMDIFMFSKNADRYILESHFANVQFTSNGAIMTGSVTASTMGEKKFYFVANGWEKTVGLQGLEVGVSTDRDMERISFTDEQISEHNHIMTAQTDLNIASTNETMKLDLVRKVGHVEIVNDLPDYTIEVVQLQNTRNGSMLFKTNPVSFQLRSQLAMQVTGMGTGSKISGKLFAYPGIPQDKFSIYISGTKKGVSTQYLVPLKTNNGYIGVEQNISYTVQLLPPNNSGSEITVICTVRGWTVKPPIDTEIQNSTRNEGNESYQYLIQPL